MLFFGLRQKRRFFLVRPGRSCCILLERPGSLPFAPRSLSVPGTVPLA